MAELDVVAVGLDVVAVGDIQWWYNKICGCTYSALFLKILLGYILDFIVDLVNFWNSDDILLWSSYGQIRFEENSFGADAVTVVRIVLYLQYEP